MDRTEWVSDPKIREEIRKNQKEFLEEFEHSFFGRLYQLGWKLRSGYRYERPPVEDYIEAVNRLKLRNLWLSLILQLKTIKHHLVNHIPTPRVRQHFQDYLSICCIIKNEGLYMKEWLDFHLAVGVDRFYVFDNGSTDGIIEILKPYTDTGIVQLFQYPGKLAQIFAYNDALRMCRGRSRWLAFLDPDEFLFPTEKDDLKEFLKEYEPYPAIGVHWVIYGPGGHEKRPHGLVTENYVQTFADRNHEMNCRIKSILQPRQTLCIASTHYGIYKHGQLGVDENLEPITGAAMFRLNGMACTFSNSIKKIRINHYWTRSLEELQAKCMRGYADITENPEYERILKRIEYPMIEDRSILKYIQDGKFVRKRTKESEE